MRVHCLQHVAFEGPAGISTWLHENGFRMTRTAFFARDPLPRLEEFDMLVVLGGPMSVHDELTVPWLAVEKAFVQAAIEAGKPVLGICLGAQIIAEVLGAGVRPNPVPEIGWWPVRGLTVPDPRCHSFPSDFIPFHWHGETFDLPPGAIRLASSQACANQAFQWGDRVIGLQFHLECTRDSCKALTRHCARDIVPGPWVQLPSVILEIPESYFTRADHELIRVLDFLHGKASPRPAGP